MINCIKKLHCKSFLHLYHKLLHLLFSFNVEINKNVRKKLNVLRRGLKLNSPPGKNSNTFTRFGTKFATPIISIK